MKFRKQPFWITNTRKRPIKRQPEVWPKKKKRQPEGMSKYVCEKKNKYISNRVINVFDSIIPIQQYYYSCTKVSLSFFFPNNNLTFRSWDSWSVSLPSQEYLQSVHLHRLKWSTLRQTYSPIFKIQRYGLE